MIFADINDEISQSKMNIFTKLRRNKKIKELSSIRLPRYFKSKESDLMKGPKINERE